VHLGAQLAYLVVNLSTEQTYLLRKSTDEPLPTSIIRVKKGGISPPLML